MDNRFIVETLPWFVQDILILYITILIWFVSIFFAFKTWEKLNKYNLSFIYVLKNLEYLSYIKYNLFYVFILIFIHLYVNILYSNSILILLIFELFIIISLWFLIYYTLWNILIKYLIRIENGIELLFVKNNVELVVKYLDKLLVSNNKKIILKDLWYVYRDKIENLDFINIIYILKKLDVEDNNTKLVIKILSEFRVNIDSYYNNEKSRLIYLQFLLIILDLKWISKDLKYRILKTIYIPLENEKIKFDLNSVFEILISNREYLLYKFDKGWYLKEDYKYFNLFKKYFLKYWYKDYSKFKFYAISSMIREMEYNINNKVSEYANSETLTFLKNIVIKWEELDLFNNDFYINTIKKYFIHFLENNIKYIKLGDYRDYFFNDFVFPIFDNISNKEYQLVHFVTLLIVDIDELEEYHKKILSIIDKYIKFNDNKEYIANYIKLYWINKLDYSNEEKDTIFTDNIIIKKYYFDFVIKYLGNREN